MAPSTNLVSLFLVTIAFGYCFAMYALQTECPSIESDSTASCASDCNSTHNCMPDHWCCNDACGTTSCTMVMASCRVGDIAYFHHDFMPLTEEDTEEGSKCGDCWCQNGGKVCNVYGCDGPRP